MAREKMVTRTVSTTVVNVMGVDISTAKTFTVEITLTGTFKDDADILKVVNKRKESDELVYVAIVSTEVKETLYGMPESVFMQYAKELPPRATKTE